MATTAGTSARGLPWPGDASAADVPSDTHALVLAIEAMMNSPLVLGSSITATGDVIATGGALNAAASVGGWLVLSHTSAGAGLKRSLLKSLSGATSLQSIPDAATTSTKVGWSMDHATGAVDFPNSATVPTASPGDNDTSAASTAFVQAAIAAAVAAAAQVPAGTIIANAGSATPTGYLPCDGTAVSRTTYAALFAQISTAYGAGDGSTTFNVPDSRGRPLYAKGTHTDVDTLGKNEGAAVGSRRAAHVHALGGHTHPNSGTTSTAAASVSVSTDLSGSFTSVNSQSHTHPYSNTTGGPAGVSDLAAVPYLVVNHFIKT